MKIEIVENEITIPALKEIAQEFYKTMIKGVVDIDKEIVAFGGEYHIDANQKLIDFGSNQANVWGFNIYLELPRNKWVEYISLINIRPALGNTDMEISDPRIREKMGRIIDSKII